MMPFASGWAPWSKPALNSGWEAAGGEDEEGAMSAAGFSATPTPNSAATIVKGCFRTDLRDGQHVLVAIMFEEEPSSITRLATPSSVMRSASA